MIRLLVLSAALLQIEIRLLDYHPCLVNRVDRVSSLPLFQPSVALERQREPNRVTGPMYQGDTAPSR